MQVGGRGWRRRREAKATKKQQKPASKAKTADKKEQPIADFKEPTNVLLDQSRSKSINVSPYNLRSKSSKVHFDISASAGSTEPVKSSDLQPVQRMTVKHEVARNSAVSSARTRHGARILLQSLAGLEDTDGETPPRKPGDEMQ